MKSFIDMLKTIPLWVDTLRGAFSKLKKLIDKFKSRKIKRKVKKAIKNEDRSQASTDLDDIFRDD